LVLLALDPMSYAFPRSHHSPCEARRRVLPPGEINFKAPSSVIVVIVELDPVVNRLECGCLRIHLGTLSFVTFSSPWRSDGLRSARRQRRFPTHVRRRLRKRTESHVWRRCWRLLCEGLSCREFVRHARLDERHGRIPYGRRRRDCRARGSLGFTGVLVDGIAGLGIGDGEVVDILEKIRIHLGRSITGARDRFGLLRRFQRLSMRGAGRISRSSAVVNPSQLLFSS
jgi:hypothetical protein